MGMVTKVEVLELEKQLGMGVEVFANFLNTAKKVGGASIPGGIEFDEVISVINQLVAIKKGK